MSTRLAAISMVLFSACAEEEPPPVCGDSEVERPENCDDGGASYRCNEQCNIGPSLTAGEMHTCFVGPNGSVACWGRDLRGESLPPDGVMFVVAAGDQHSCGLAWDDSGVTCWGEDHFGYNQTAPPVGEYRQLAGGVAFSCALTSAQGLVCWGLDDDGQASPPDSGTFTSVVAGDVHACALARDGLVSCWGAGLVDDDCGDHCGQSLPPTTAMTHIAAGGRHSCGVVAADASLHCWGSDTAGQSTVPAGRFVHVAAGSAHSCAILDDGTATCWGRNNYGHGRAGGHLCAAGPWWQPLLWDACRWPG